MLYACPEVEKASEINYQKEAVIFFDNASCALYSRPYYQAWNNDLEYSNILPKGNFTVTTVSLPVSFPLSKLNEIKGGENIFILLPEEAILRDDRIFKYLASLEDKQKEDIVNPWILRPQSSVYSVEKHAFLEYGYN